MCDGVSSFLLFYAQGLLSEDKGKCFSIGPKELLNELILCSFNTADVDGLTSLHTSMVPKMTCRPSKKLSPMMMTVAPPVVQPSLGLMALMLGVAATFKHTHAQNKKSEKLNQDVNNLIAQQRSLLRCPLLSLSCLSLTHHLCSPSQGSGASEEY